VGKSAAIWSRPCDESAQKMSYRKAMCDFLQLLVAPAKLSSRLGPNGAALKFNPSKGCGLKDPGSAAPSTAPR
jgi:hypothetical protein